VALENLRILEAEGLVARAGVLGARLLAGLKQLEAHPHVGEARGLGLMAAVELVADKSPRSRFDPSLQVGARVVREMLERGVVTRIVGDVILLAPPLVTSEAQIDRIVEVTGQAVRKTLE
jgi:4-aminobutyrate--pyruvate transaminase